MFRHRVMFPIIDLRGNIIGFGGRVLDGSQPKYLNTGNTPVFNKGNNLFSMNFAKNADTKRLILCEGYMDRKSGRFRERCCNSRNGYHAGTGAAHKPLCGGGNCRLRQ